MFTRNGAYVVDASKPAITAPPTISEPAGIDTPTLGTPRAAPATPKPLPAPRPLLQSMRKSSLSEIIADASFAHAPKIPRAHLVHDAPSLQART
jgi:hypothetical protein